MRVAMLTGGGDCPGLNAVIRAVVRKGEMHHGDELVGFLDGWEGVLDIGRCPSTCARSAGMLPRGGTLLGTSRRRTVSRAPTVSRESKRPSSTFGLDALIAIGGDGTLGVRQTSWDEEGLPVVGVPKTIDNDIMGTEVTFGFDTAVQIATDAIDRLHTTAESHDRVMVVEVMGRARRVDRDLCRHRRRGHRDPDPGEALRHRRRVLGAHAPPRARPLRVDRRRRRRGPPEEGHVGGARRRARRVGPRPPRWHRQSHRAARSRSAPASRRG